MSLIRPAVPTDGPGLARIDHATWSPLVTPAPARPAATDLFARHDLSDVLVADRDGEAVGFVLLDRPTPVETNRHVLLVTGLAVDPAHQGQGLGRLLVDGVIEEATRRGARKLSLRVLGGNFGAQQLYASCGFTVEGVLREEFLIEGRYVDDLLMARFLTG